MIVNVQTNCHNIMYEVKIILERMSAPKLHKNIETKGRYFSFSYNFPALKGNNFHFKQIFQGGCVFTLLGLILCFFGTLFSACNCLLAQTGALIDIVCY